MAYMYQPNVEAAAKKVNATIAQSKPVRSRNKFKKSEDVMLVRLVNQYGTRDWEGIASLMPGRNPRQCKERYQNYLSPNLSHEPWTQEEDLLLEQKLNELGSKWVTISKFFKNRTDTMLKNRWLVLSRRLTQSQDAKLKNHNTHIIRKEAKVEKKIEEPQHKIEIPSLYNLINSCPMRSQTTSSIRLPSLTGIPFDIDQFTKLFSGNPINVM